MNNLGKAIVILIIIASLCFVVAGSSTAKEIDAKDVKWNVSDSLTLKKDADVLIYEDGDYSFRIIGSNDNDLAKMKDGFTKGENGFYVNEGGSHHQSTSFDSGAGFSSIAYGEYVKINGNTYWIEASWFKVSSGTYDKVENDMSNVNTTKLIEYMNYFNEKNNVEIVDL